MTAAAPACDHARTARAPGHPFSDGSYRERCCACYQQRLLYRDGSPASEFAPPAERRARPTPRQAAPPRPVSPIARIYGAEIIALGRRLAAARALVESLSQHLDHAVDSYNAEQQRSTFTSTRALRVIA